MGKGAINLQLAVINADDFYGRDAFEVIAKELMRPRDRKGDYCMVGFRVGNTMTENGSVARGVCENKDGFPYLSRRTHRHQLRSRNIALCSPTKTAKYRPSNRILLCL